MEASGLTLEPSEVIPEASGLTLEASGLTLGLPESFRKLPEEHRTVAEVLLKLPEEAQLLPEKHQRPRKERRQLQEKRPILPVNGRPSVGVASKPPLPRASPDRPPSSATIETLLKGGEVRLGRVYGEDTDSMSAKVPFNELLDAFEWVSASGTYETAAYVHRTTGRIYWVGDAIDEEPPEDLEDGSLYVAIPHKKDLDLGKDLALRFVLEHLPRSYDTVSEYFRRHGAYARFKSLLEQVNQLEAWYKYEESAVEQALREWAQDEGLDIA